MIRSSKPSPLTSPAEATEKPLWSPLASPLILKPLLPSRVDRSRLPLVRSANEALPNTT